MPAMLRGEKRRGSRRNPARNPVNATKENREQRFYAPRISGELAWACERGYGTYRSAIESIAREMRTVSAKATCPQSGDRAVGSRFEDVRKVGKGVSGKAIYRVNWMARGADRRDKGLSQVADAQSQRKSFHAQQNKKSEGLGVGWTERNMEVATDCNRCMWLNKTGVSPEDWSAELDIVDGAKGEKAVEGGWE
ncbi:hypothetical protein DFH09DRAFT_1088434 [Mycena vulgaris]|nr:hypothetical protein DFH09DRAFT_1088434 [Mycena vulgaris]